MCRLHWELNILLLTSLFIAVMTRLTPPLRYDANSTKDLPGVYWRQSIQMLGGGGRGVYSWEFLVGVCRPVLQILTLFQTKKCHFPHPFSDQTSKIHTRFQTWPLGRNYVIITSIRAQTKKFFKCISNSHIFISFLFIWNWNDKYMYAPVVPSNPDQNEQKCFETKKA